MAVTRNNPAAFHAKDLKSMDVVILCGGLGKRLRAVLGKNQKVMARVGKKPFLDFILMFLKKQGFKRVILCTGFQGDLVKKYYTKNSLGLNILFSPEHKALGTGGAIKNAAKHIKSKVFLAMNGDSFCPLNFKRLLKFHELNEALATVAVYKLKKNVDSGKITLDKSFRIKRFDEKKASKREQFVNAGIYCFERNIFKFMPKQKVFSLEYDLFPRLIKENFYGFPTKEEFLDIGTPERYDKAQKFMKRKGSLK